MDLGVGEGDVGLVAAAALLSCGSVWAQGTYPTRTVTLVVPYSAGGSTDLITRLIARELTAQMGRQVVVDNRVGGGGASHGRHHHILVRARVGVGGRGTQNLKALLALADAQVVAIADPAETSSL